jgi:hypothetical protein
LNCKVNHVQQVYKPQVLKLFHFYSFDQWLPDGSGTTAKPAGQAEVQQTAGTTEPEGTKAHSPNSSLAKRK